MRRLALLIACLLVTAGVNAEPVSTTAPDDALAASACVRWAPLRASAPPNIHLVALADPLAFLAAFNADPPASDVVADQIYVNRQGNAARLFFVSNGCLINMFDMPWVEVERLMGTAL